MYKTDIQKEVVRCQYDVIGKLTYQNGDKHMNTMELKTKLVVAWKLHYVKIVHMGKGFHRVFLGSMEFQSRILSTGTLNLTRMF